MGNPPFVIKTGKTHIFEADVTAATVVGDFGHAGRFSDRDPRVHASRVLRPGAIILANLDVDGPIPNPRPDDMSALVDAHQPDLRPNDRDLARVGVRAPAEPRLANRVGLHVAPSEAKMVRLFQYQRTGEQKPRLVLGGNISELTLPPGAKPELDYYVEAVTLPGDPSAKWRPGLPTPTKPLYPASLPRTEGPNGGAIYKERLPGEVWLELVHEGKTRAPIGKDVALLTIAPFLLIPNTQPVERLYVVYQPVLTHAFVHDLLSACQSIWPNDVRLPANPSDPIVPSTPDSRCPVYVVDARNHQDIWIQDVMEVGYCKAPHQQMHVVLQCARPAALDRFVRREMPAPGVGIFSPVAAHIQAAGDPNDSANYGGNVEVTPPIHLPTPPLAADRRSPALPAHPAARLGKIVVGDSERKPIDAGLRRFLLAQMVQPVVPLDVSWLRVGHVDEFMSCIPDQRGGFRVAWAYPPALAAILTEALKFNPTGFNRGLLHVIGTPPVKGGGAELPPTPVAYAEATVREMLEADGRFNEQLNDIVLEPLRRRVAHALASHAEDFIPIPIFFETPTGRALRSSKRAKPGEHKTGARTVSSVNLQVVNGHLLVPQPYGPRLPPSDARTVVEAAISKLFRPARRPPVLATETDGFWFWCRPNMTFDHVAWCFCPVRDHSAKVRSIKDEYEKPADPIEPDMLRQYAKLVGKFPELKSFLNPRVPSEEFMRAWPKFRDVLREHPRNKNLPLDKGGTFRKWCKLWIPEKSIDIIECYLASVLAPLGQTVHFVDCWEYHTREGEVHCGTNALRKPPLEKWWDGYDPSTSTWYRH